MDWQKLAPTSLLTLHRDVPFLSEDKKDFLQLFSASNRNKRRWTQFKSVYYNTLCFRCVNRRLSQRFKVPPIKERKEKIAKIQSLKLTVIILNLKKWDLIFFLSFWNWEGVVSLTFFRALQCRGRGGKNEKKEKNGRRKYIIEVLFDNVLKIIIFILFLE